MQIVLDFFISLMMLSNAMAPYILFGLLFAGILHEIVPQDLVSRHLGKGNIFSVIKATLFGIPLPVCSCGVVPLATGIKKSGASKGATLSFLISTPITGVDSILATYGIFGFVFTIYRVITSIVIAMIAGILTNFFDKEAPIKAPKFSMKVTPLKGVNFHKTSFIKSSQPQGVHKKFSFKKAWHYSFVTLLSDIAKPLFYGLILGALISIMIPQNLSDILMTHAWIAYLLSIAIAVPMYVCATASLPIAASLMLSGVSAGAAFVFLCAGPATNIVTMGVVKKILGSKSLYIYLCSIVIGSIVFGLGLDYLFDIAKINPITLIDGSEDLGWISDVSSVILWGLLIYFLFKKSKIKTA
ncbi:SO_0444 family Cu/Zn efflux transporter [Sulfurospirillum sp. 1612]|uniref:SO_0444 family Cu/Zn efflux transporter n=1 Tax=Sulfurospirillum sp. 1612 TaxID=3094835 RepID=UPI002F93897E